MKIVNKLMSLVLIYGSFLFFSCETVELDLTDNPNALIPDQADVDFYLNSIQEDFVRQLDGDADGGAGDNWTTGGNQNGDGLSRFGLELVRLDNANGRDYQSMYQAGDGDDEWSNAYAGIMIDIRKMNELAIESNQTRHIGIGQFIEAYTMITLVDFFGDVPYSEALLGSENLNPVVDTGASIYDAALSLLDLAIINFQSTPSTDPTNDFFYNNDFEKWEKAANTLKMKIFLQRRLVDASAKTSFDAIVNTGIYISSSDDDFQYNWPGTSARPTSGSA